MGERRGVCISFCSVRSDSMKCWYLFSSKWCLSDLASLYSENEFIAVGTSASEKTAKNANATKSTLPSLDFTGVLSTACGDVSFVLAGFFCGKISSWVLKYLVHTHPYSHNFPCNHSHIYTRSRHILSKQAPY